MWSRVYTRSDHRFPVRLVTSDAPTANVMSMWVKLHCLEQGDQKIPSLCMFATKITPSKQPSPERRFGVDNIQASTRETEVCEKVEPTEGSDHAALPWHESSVVFGVGKFKVSLFVNLF